MTFLETCINRPVFTTVMSLMLITIGLVYGNKLELRGSPNIAPPIISVTSIYEGADASYMEKQITTRIEKAIKTVKYLDHMSSTSKNGESDVTLFFQLDADIDVALNDVRSKIAELNGMFPADMNAPAVSKLDTDSFPSLWISVSSNVHDSLELTRIVDEVIKSQLEKLSTVGKANIFGAKYYSIQISPLINKLSQYKIGLDEIEQAIRSQNKDYPAGVIKTTNRNFVLRLNSSLQNIDDFNNIIIKTYPTGEIIKLRDIAKVSLDAIEDDMILRYNGNRAMAIGLVKQSTANIITLSDSVRKELPKLDQELPDGIKIAIAYDGATALNESIRSIFHTIFEAICLVSVVIYLFLGNIRVALIPIVTIPKKKNATCYVMYILVF
jgi:HAE1 family hydrophobic/amphiphilic exporter-1